MRNSHPLDFISELLQKMYSIINNIAEKHGTWRLQDVQNETNYLVPHGVKLFMDRSEQASKCTVTRIGNGGVVTAPYCSGSVLKFRSKKTVDMDNQLYLYVWHVECRPISLRMSNCSCSQPRKSSVCICRHQLPSIVLHTSHGSIEYCEHFEALTCAYKRRTGTIGRISKR